MDLVNLPEDLTLEEKSSLIEYKANGCPGLPKINDNQVFKWFELYMAGKSYKEIAELTKDKKDLIVYVAVYSKWHEKRMDYYRDMAGSFANKLKKAKMSSANTVVNAITALSKYHDKKFNEFLITNDQSIIDNMDSKVLANYFKSLDMLDKLIRPSDDDEPKQPTVNITVPAGSTISQKADGSVEVVNDDVAAGDLLKALSKYQRSKEK